jgi:hypothetical protein
MGGKAWNEERIQLLLKNLIMDPDTNAVLNKPEIGLLMGVSGGAIEVEITKLIKAGRIPRYNRRAQLEPYRRIYTTTEIKRIIAMFNAGASVKDVAYRFGRTPKGISNLRDQLRSDGLISPRFMPWTDAQLWLLIHDAVLDDSGIVTNYHYLAQRTGHPIGSCKDKLVNLRKQGLAPKPRRKGAPDATLEVAKKQSRTLWLHIRNKV